MKKTIFKHLFSLVLVLACVAAMAFAFTSCENKKNTSKNSSDEAADTTSSAAGEENLTDEEKITITVSVKGSDGKVTDFTIVTAEKFLRAALESENLIEGDEGEYGLYVKFVNGERADYDEDKAYWSFSKNGEYMMASVDATPIADGDTFLIEYTAG